MPKSSPKLPTYDLATIKALVRAKARATTIYAHHNILEECLTIEHEQDEG
jgi:hypothetical protein